MVFWEEWQNKKHQESVSPYRQRLPWPNLSGVTIFKFWSLLKVCKTQEKAWTVNCGLLQSISALGTVAATHLPLRQPRTCSWSSLHTACGNQAGKNKPCPPITGDLCSDCWLLFLVTHMYRQSDGGTFVALPPIFDSSSPSSWSDSPGDLKAHCPPPFSFFSFFFSFWESDIKDFLKLRETLRYSQIKEKLRDSVTTRPNPQVRLKGRPAEWSDGTLHSNSKV